MNVGLGNCHYRHGRQRIAIFLTFSMCMQYCMHIGIQANTASSAKAHTQFQGMIPPLRIEDNGIPRYVQIREQLLRAIGAGALKPGEQMPTMRELAVELSVDLNTVRHAYDDLERGGFIDIVRARGTYVAQHPPQEDREARAERLERLAQETIAIANAAGIDPAELANRILSVTQTKRGKK